MEDVMMQQGMGSIIGACAGGMAALMGAFWVAVIAGIVYVVRGIGQRPQLTVIDGPPDTTEDVALTTLRDRFARGEIDLAEYEERRRALTGDERHWL